MAGLAVLIGLVLLGYRLIGKPKKKDAVMTGAVVLLVIGFFIGGMSAFDEVTGMVKTQTQSITSGEQATSAVISTGQACERQTDGTNTLNVVYRNVENSSLGYLASSVSAESGDESLASGTTTAGVSLSYLALSVPPCMTGKIYALGDTGESSAVVDFSSYELTSNYDIKGAPASVISVKAYDSTYTASSGYNATTEGESASGDWISSPESSSDGTAYYANSTFSAGTSLNFYIDYKVNDTTGAYGTLLNGQPASDGIILSFDSVDASKFSANALTLVSDTAGVTLTKIPCPASIANNRNADACWKTRTLLATDGDVRLRGTLKADLGDPTVTGDNPILYIDDQQYFRDTDGTVKYGVFDSSGTNQGLGGVALTFVVA